MNGDQIGGVVRAVGPAMLMWLANKGWLPAGSIADILAAVSAVLAAGWSIANNRSGKIIK